MNMLLRLLWIYIRARSRAPCHPLGPCLTPFVVMPTDLDICRHVNNGIYFSIMDLGRVDMLIRSGLFKAMRKARLSAVVAAETIRFRRSLTLFQRFNVETRVIGWDDKAFLMEQRFLRPSRRGDAMDVVAEAVVRARFVADRKAVPSADFLSLLGAEGVPSPELPEWIAQWNAKQSQMRDADHSLV